MVELASYCVADSSYHAGPMPLSAYAYQGDPGPAPGPEYSTQRHHPSHIRRSCLAAAAQNQWAPFYAERGCGQAKNVAAGQKLRDLVNAAPTPRMQVGGPLLACRTAWISSRARHRPRLHFS